MFPFNASNHPRHYHHRSVLTLGWLHKFCLRKDHQLFRDLKRCPILIFILIMKDTDTDIYINASMYMKKENNVH